MDVSAVLERNSTAPVQAWVSNTNTRGTYDIIWSCVQTVFLCAWVSVCVNAPSRKYRSRDLLVDKFYFTLLTLLGPELVFALACCQYSAARRSVQDFKRKKVVLAGCSPWTITHGFYANMGCITVRPPTSPHRRTQDFRVNAKELLYLVEHGHMDYPDVPREEIMSRSKVDGLGRLITLTQTLYFVLATLARPLQKLAITTMELTVLGFILCTLCTFVVWWSKPVDVEIGHVFPLKSSLDFIIEEARRENGTWYPPRQTPLDFISCEPWVAKNLWHYYVNILNQLGIFRERKPEEMDGLPYIDKFESIDWPLPGHRISTLVMAVLGTMYAATFFAAWNYHFPTDIEKTFWRVVVSIQITVVVIASAFELTYLSFEAFATPRSTSPPALEPAQQTSSSEKGTVETSLELSKVWSRPCNNDHGQHACYDVPLRSLLVTTPLCATYVICRWYLLVEDCIGLRSVPPSTFQKVDWAQYFPSFGK